MVPDSTDAFDTNVTDVLGTNVWKQYVNAESEVPEREASPENFTHCVHGPHDYRFHY